MVGEILSHLVTRKGNTMGCVFSSWETAMDPLTKPGSFPLKTITPGVEGSCAWQAPGLP